MQRIKIVGVLVLLFISSNLYSQKKRDKIEYLSNFDMKTVRWGFYLGLNDSDFKISYKNKDLYPEAIDRILTETSLGFNVGLLGDLRLHKNVNLRLEPGLYYNKKTVIFNYLAEESAKKRDAESTFMYVPLLMQFSADRYRNIRPYVAAGVAYGHNFTSNYDDQDDNSSNHFRLQANNYFYELGIGMDFYFYFFKFSPSLRGVFAINNELQYDEKSDSPWTAPIGYLGTRAIFLRLTFQ